MRHLLWIGDSITRYQYLDFVFRLHFDRDSSPGTLVNERRWGGWDRFFRGTTEIFNDDDFAQAVLQNNGRRLSELVDDLWTKDRLGTSSRGQFLGSRAAYMFCDCARSYPLREATSFENRLYVNFDKQLVVSYHQSMGDWKLKGRALDFTEWRVTGLEEEVLTTSTKEAPRSTNAVEPENISWGPVPLLAFLREVLPDQLLPALGRTLRSVVGGGRQELPCFSGRPFLILKPHGFWIHDTLFEDVVEILYAALHLVKASPILANERHHDNIGGHIADGHVFFLQSTPCHPGSLTCLIYQLRSHTGLRWIKWLRDTRLEHFGPLLPFSREEEISRRVVEIGDNVQRMRASVLGAVWPLGILHLSGPLLDDFEAMVDFVAREWILHAEPWFKDWALGEGTSLRGLGNAAGIVGAWVEAQRKSQEREWRRRMIRPRHFYPTL